MRTSLLILLAFVANIATAAPALNAPASAAAGSKLTVEISGSDNPRDFVTIVPKGTPEGQYRSYFYVENRDKVLAMPPDAGEYELRWLAADSPYKTRVSRAIRITAVTATVKAPTPVAAGGNIDIAWTGPNNGRDYVGIGETTAGGRPYLNYEYTSRGSPVKLRVPDAAGTYEIRYFLGEGDRIIARQTLTVTAVTAALTVPAQAAAGTKFKLSWTGPNNPGDFITIVKADAPEKSFQRYEYTKKGNTLEFTAPDQGGQYEARYLMANSYQTLARAPLMVGAASATLKAPGQVAAGSKFQVSWTGPDNAGDFVTLVKAGTPEKTFDRYEYTKRGATLTFTAPDVVGQYEVRYATGQQYLTLARATVTVTAITGSLTGPATAVAGESFKVSWKGPDNARNFITVVAKGTREGDYGSYFYTSAKSNPGTLVAPLKPGDYELRYSTAEKFLTLARADIKITPAKDQPGKVAVTLAAGAKNGAVEIILDASGSMLQKLGNERRIDIAKRTLNKLVGSTIPAGTPFAFRVFGREVDSCQTDLDVPVAPLNPASVQQRIGALVAKNGAKTPIGASLALAADDLKSVTGEKLIVLVTDGEETCGGDPAAAIDTLRQSGVTTRVSIVGFALDDAALAATFKRWSDAGGGAFFDAKDAAALEKSLTDALRPGFEVVNAQGQVLVSGIVGGEPVTVPAGSHQVRIRNRANSAKPVVVKPQETANVAF